jgi:predicted patatin/cPLA2 family phospholipase
MASLADEPSALRTALAPRPARGPRRVALIQEGGGIRGAFGAGVQAGFAEAGLPYDAFDALYGSSAGALNLMYWVSRRPWCGTRVYLDALTSGDGRSFFRFRRAWDLLESLARGRPVLDLSAVGHAMTAVLPFDAEAVRQHHAPILVPVTRVAPLSAEILDVRALPPDELMPALLAGASIPVLADTPPWRGGAYVDGGFAMPLPVDRALADGCTDLVAVLTLPRWRQPPRWEEWILRALARRRGSRALVKSGLRASRSARRAGLDRLRRPPFGVNVTVIAPAVGLAPSLERRRERIARLVDAGREAGRLALELARARSVA